VAAGRPLESTTVMVGSGCGQRRASDPITNDEGSGRRLGGDQRHVDVWCQGRTLAKGYNMDVIVRLVWKVRYVPEADGELDGLDAREAIAVENVVRKLTALGRKLPFPTQQQRRGRGGPAGASSEGRPEPDATAVSRGRRRVRHRCCWS
jgi:hypothetical protein